MDLNKKWLISVLGGGLALGLIVIAFISDPVPVDLGIVFEGPFAVSVDDDGEARVRDVYLVSAPLPGRMLRINYEVGDNVVANETLLARILPTNPNFLDVRTRAELKSRLEAAEATRVLAEAELSRMEAEVVFSQSEFQRAQKLLDRGTISQAAMDKTQRLLQTNNAALKTAKARLSIREHELETARAALINPSDQIGVSEGLTNVDGDSCCLNVRSPIDGKILRILIESEGVVTAGAPLIEIGDPRDLEIVVDLLSNDAVQIHPGDAVDIMRWGGSDVLKGEVDRVEPYGFSKVSSLGIEEQRVNVVVHFLDDYENWERLGHGYRVEVRIYLWQEENVLQVPLSALFRQGIDWAVYVKENNRAQLRRIKVGHLNQKSAQVLDGLTADDQIVLYASDRVKDGIRIEARGN